MLRQAVFLVGGAGTRLGERTRETPKPLLNVGGRPFIDYLIDESARHGFTEIILLAGFLGREIELRYDGMRRHDATVRVISEKSPLGTGGCLRSALSELHDKFLLSNGDSFFDINLRALEVPDAGTMTMALCTNVPGKRFGTVRFRHSVVEGFYPADASSEGPINAGIYVFSREVVEAFPDGRSSLEIDHFPSLANKGCILGQPFDRYFVDMGVPADLSKAEEDMPLKTCRPAVFFDRDGVLNRDSGYVCKPDQFEWMPGAREAIRACNDRGYFAFVVTNQAGVARGLYSERDVRVLHDWMQADLAEIGAHVDAFKFCPHHPDGAVSAYRKTCSRRKPGPGMIWDIMGQWRVDVNASFLVGDSPSDLEAAAGAGIPGYRYLGGDLAKMITKEMTR